MKRKGFTVAEILITLGIIGVAAMLTIPTFVSDYRKKNYAITLSTAVSNLETALTTMIARENADDLLDTEAWQELKNGNNYTLNSNSNDDVIEGFVNRFSRTMPVLSRDADAFSFKDLSTPNGFNQVNGRFVRLKSKTGVEYNILVDNVSKANARREIDTLNARSNYQNKAAELYIDINGDNQPNLLGRDVFHYDIGVDGRLYPFGSREYCFYNDVIYQDVENMCVQQRSGNFCAAYLMENGYNMDY